MRPWALDLCCGGGGFSAGLWRAGFNVVGVDIADQPDYPFPFIRADALTVDLSGFSLIVGSPPCQRWSRATPPDRRDSHPDVLTPLRERLRSLPAGIPWVLENVPGAPMVNPVQLCGDTLRLGVRRHRLFESNVPLVGTPCFHDADRSPVPVYGSHGGIRSTLASDGRSAMGADWMPWRTLTQSIPPAYGAFLGAQLWAHVDMSTAGGMPRILADVVQVASVTEVDHDQVASVTADDLVTEEPRSVRFDRIGKDNPVIPNVTYVRRRSTVTKIGDLESDGSDPVMINFGRPGRPVAMTDVRQGDAIGPPCRHCQRAPVSRPATGRWARYCSHACRQAAYRAREAANGRRV